MEYFSFLTDPQLLGALVTLAALEIVLGIDNVVFISILVSKLPEEQAKRARQIGLGLALVFRIALLFVLSWIMKLTAPVISFSDYNFSWRDIILLVGGLFLIAKAIHEIHNLIEDDHEVSIGDKAKAAFSFIIMQVIIIDLVFSVDSIITAVGMAQDIRVMIAAVLVAVAVMYMASGPVSDFITKHPTTKMLALAFLILIGVALVADGFGVHIPRAYVYSSMAFAGIVEFFNVLASNKRKAKKRNDAVN
ncbi:TerC family protein [Microvirga sp. W0021]|uniref:TerC family protein n=1 Tax=Hohaiivirga grylli TaxID=3133970 RepID=A0ABV0BIN4_9HYPH